MKPKKKKSVLKTLDNCIEILLVAFPRIENAKDALELADVITLLRHVKKEIVDENQKK